ncbi:hypothetical protein JCM19298_528 [Nonlabens ulvanivorans]|nr:hypothetical protein JCM19298_528 [Nonlabens ulvanivorans]
MCSISMQEKRLKKQTAIPQHQNKNYNSHVFFTKVNSGT